MLSFKQPGERQFGGVGAMIGEPGLQLQIVPHAQFEAPPEIDRIEAIARRVWRALGQLDEPACRIELLSAPPEHVGLGTGTQISLAVAAGLNAFLGRASLAPIELAKLSGRGERSAVGTYGFVLGGLIVEAGKRSDDALSPLVARHALPEEWRIVLILPRRARGPHGVAERNAFASLPPVSQERTAALTQELTAHLIPAAAAGDFVRFSESLYRYGHDAGLAFSVHQGGPFASPRVAKLVEIVRSLGIRGVGQSSWGPTVFALVESQKAAETLVEHMRERIDPNEEELRIARPNNSGASIREA
jgi:beta-RFAP synthase